MHRRTGEATSVWWLALVAGMASYLDSAAIVSSGIAIVIMQDELNLSAGQVGVVSSLLTFAIAIGAATGGNLGDRFGRRRVFLVTMAMIIVATLLLVTAQTFAVYALGILLIGLGSGADLPVSLATISEAAARSNRGRLVSFSHILWKVGTIVSQLLGALFGDAGRIGEQILFGHIGIVAVLVLLARLGIPESERWVAAAAAAKQQPSAVRSTGSLRTLFRKPFVVPFVGLLVFYSLVNLGMNTNGQFGALMFTEAAGTSVSYYSTVGLVTTIIGFLLSFALLQTMDGDHRMTWFIIGAASALTGSFLPMVFGPTTLTLTAMLVLWAIASVFAGEPLMKIWAQESFPTLLRSSAQGAIIAVARIAAAVLGLVTPFILLAGPRVLFGTIFAMALVAYVTAYAVFRHRSTTEFDLESLTTDGDAAGSEQSTSPAATAGASRRTS